MNSFNTINPATQEIITSYQYHTNDEIHAIVEHCHEDWKEWRFLSIKERAPNMLKLSKLLEDQKLELGKLITTEMGKPLSQAIQEVEKCAWVCKYYAEESEAFLSDIKIDTEATNSFVSFRPLGIVFAVMPWNFPFWQVFRFAAPALMAGNAGILKHSPNTTGCGLIIETLIRQAGFPENIFRTVLADIPEIEEIVSNPKVVACTLTGSTEAGRSLAQLSAKYLKKSVLELGGSDPYIILDDADLMDAAKKCVTGRMINSGQSCIAAKRFIVTSKNKDAFTKYVKAELQEYVIGDPLSDKTTTGPMARKDLSEKLQKQLDDSVKGGAKIIYQSDIPNEPGFYSPITLLSEVKKGTPAYEDELFGPIAVIIEAKDEAECFEIANDSNFGLGAAIFSTNPERATQLASLKLEAGCCFINESVKSDPRLPFGGIKQSGYGRELSSFGIHEFVNIKSVYQK